MKAQGVPMLESEQPVHFPAGDQTLFGVLTEPHTDPRGVCAVLLQGGIQTPSFGRNRMSTRLCRRLAAEGFHSLRFDYHGIADGTGEVTEFRFDDPFSEDALAAISFLRSRGLDRFILVGTCFGARTALACAPRIPGLVAVVLRRLPVREAEKDQFGAREVVPSETMVELVARAMRPRVVGALFRRDRRGAYLRIARNSLRSRLTKSYRDAHREGLARPSDRLLADIREFVALGIPLLLIAGTDDPGADAFQRAMSTELGEILETSRSLVDTRVLFGNVSATDNVVLQESVIDLTTEWLSGLVIAPILKEKSRA